MADYVDNEPKLAKGMDKWEVEEAARTLERAQEKAKKKAIDWADKI